MVMHRKKDFLLVVAGLIFFIVIGIVAEQARIFSPLKEAMRSQTVPSGLLNYGTMGKVLKRLGVIMAVPNDYARFPASTLRQIDENTPIFQKKRQVGKFLYKVNPRGEKEMPSSSIIKEDYHKEGWPLLSVTVDENGLYHPERGIITNYNGRGKKWERLAYVSYFEKGKLLFATAAGLRLHGGFTRNPPKHWKKRNYSFRLYFRDEYGVDQFKPGLLFNADCEPVKHLVVHNVMPWQRRYTASIAFAIARQTGCAVPETRVTQFYLNGKPQGYYYLSEHLNKNQWISHMGHDNFAFYKTRGGGDKETLQDYKKLETWAKNPRVKMTMQEANKVIDVDNFTRHVFSWVFCGTTDQVQGTAVLDRNRPGARWFWINWDMDQSFLDLEKGNIKRKHWEQPGLVLAAGLNKEWMKHFVRPVLFRRLVKESPEYRKYFVRLTMDLLNHRLTPDFLSSLIDYYQKLPAPHGGGESLTEEKTRLENDLGNLRKYMKHRPGFIRKEIREYFGAGEILTCRIKGAPGYRYKIDGYPEKGNYRGYYYKGKTITIEITKPQQTPNRFSHWLVNGKKYSTAVLSIPVDNDLVISPVLSDEVMLLEAVERGDAEAVKAILKQESEPTGSRAEWRRRLTYLAVIEAVEKGHGKVLKVLIENGADVHAEVDRGISLFTHALAFNHRQIVEVLRTAGAEIHLGRIKASGQLLNNFIELELKSSRYKELQLWHPLKEGKENISPFLDIQGIRGKFAFDFERKEGAAVLAVSNVEPDRKGNRLCQFGYTASRKGLELEMPKGRDIYFVVKANIPKGLVNRENYIFIQDFAGQWEREKVYFSESGWLTCLVSKKIREQSTKLQFGFRFAPGSKEDRLKIKDVQLFISY